MISTIDNIINITGTGKEAVISILQAIQKEYNYLPEEALERVCEITEITHAEIIGIASFYKQFRLLPAGKHFIKVCIGTACHVKGADRVYDSVKRELDIGDDEDTDSDGVFTVEKVSCLGCCTLAPVVQIDNITYGHVNPSMAKKIINDFLDNNNKAKAVRTLKPVKDELQGEIRVGLGSCCIASGSGDIKEAIEEVVYKNDLNVNIKHVGCVGMCHQVPLVEIVANKNKDSRLYAHVKPEDIKPILDAHFKPHNLFKRWKNNIESFIEKLQYEERWEGIEKYSIDVREKHVHAFLGNQLPIATEFRGIINPGDIDEYLTRGGFSGLKKAFSMKPGDVIEEVTSSGLKGRGGAGYLTGVKWQVVAEQNSDEKYLICNGDEGDPGAFMDRMLLESYPLRIIEGVIIAAYAVGASKGLLYIRAEYPLAVIRVREALDNCYERGMLGDNIMNSGFSFNLEIKEGAGAFVCGEETALIASVEGKRGFPRYRPPYPAEKGLWNKPTLINNTETFAQVPYILSKGYNKFASVGTKDSRGTKVFALAGKVNRGGLIEVPMGITIRQIVEDIGGGVQNSKRLKAVQIGGPSGGCIPHFLADKPVDFDSLEEAGAMMGSGGLVVLDETDCMVDIARYFLSFTQDESCGKCTFCRVGTKRMLDILEKLHDGKAVEKDLDELKSLAEWTKKGSLCGLGKTAPNPVLSTLQYFHDEYMAHIKGVCPTGKCKPLITYKINDKCIGCTICAQNCPVEAIAFKPHEIHEIDVDECTKCDICRQECPSEAVYVE